MSIKIGEERWFGKKYNAAPTDFAHNKKRGAKKKRSAGIKMLKKPCQPIKNYFLFIDFYVFLILFEKINVMCKVHFLNYRII